jgi:glycosyltransferase involved in cell wall biosynthesis
MTITNQQPQVTVLLPVYNGSRFVSEQVQSVLDQEGVDVQLRVVDDCSTDGSLVALQVLASKDPRVVVESNERNLGLIATLDRLLGLVDTAYFALCDQDDIWDRDKLRRSVDHLRVHRNSLVYSDVRIVDEQGDGVADSYLTSRRIRPVEGRDPLPFVYRNPAIGHTIVAERVVAVRARPMPSDLLFHEAWLVAVACSVGSVGFVSGRPLGSYRVHASNVIGPSKKGFLARAVRSITTADAIGRRQRTRAAALRAQGRLDPETAAVAGLYGEALAGRVRGLPKVLSVLWRRAGSAGRGRPVLEVVMYVVYGAG